MMAALQCFIGSHEQDAVSSYMKISAETVLLGGYRLTGRLLVALPVSMG